MKPFLSGRAQVSNSSLQSFATNNKETGMHVVNHNHGKAGAANEPQAQVECVKQGDKVVRLIVTCTCGERIEIDCTY